MRKALSGFAIVLLVLVGSVAAHAQERERGYGPIDHVNAATRVISVNLREYTVPVRIKATRPSGGTVPLAELRGAMRPGDALVAIDEVDFVRFEAVKKRDVWQMVKITVLDGVPE